MSAEIDRLVAERVMGWTEWKPLTGKAPSFPCFEMMPYRGGYVALHRGDAADAIAVAWSPSRSIRDAWEAVAKIGDRYGTMIHGPFVLSLHDHNGTWFASFGGFHSPESETAPLAICLAALLAVGVPCP